MQEATTISGWALAIQRALESYQVDPAPLFREAGIDIDAIKDPNARFPSHKTITLLDLGIRTTRDQAFGLTVGRFVRPTSLHALGFANWASRDLREAQTRMCRYFKVLTTCTYGEIVEDRDTVGVQVMAYPNYLSRLTSPHFEAILSCCVQTARHLMPGRFRLHHVRLTRSRPEQGIESFNRFFKCPIEWESDRTALYIERELADMPLPTANPELAHQNEQLCKEYIARFDRQDIVNQVSNKLVEMLPHGEPSMELVASEVMVSCRTLQRKLKDHGTCYKQLLDDIRKEMAIQYARQQHVPIGEISYRLGFAHISNFSRAFKRWTGKTPVDFREQAL
ncbi:AraC family transcriptional regulator [Motiliproteus sp.]|uniref:AraC family transcriptional regulator n=1 Tax=Motiliproteus sp. TaxID=1898955 RepID=UPI003BAC1667